MLTQILIQCFTDTNEKNHLFSIHLTIDETVLIVYKAEVQKRQKLHVRKSPVELIRTAIQSPSTSPPLLLLVEKLNFSKCFSSKARYSETINEL